MIEINQTFSSLSFLNLSLEAVTLEVTTHTSHHQFFPDSSIYSFSFLSLIFWSTKHLTGLRWPKEPQWWQTMCLGPLGFLRRDLATWFCYLFNMEHWGHMWLITPQWWQVVTNLDLLNSLGWDLTGGLGLKAFFSTFWDRKSTRLNSSH